jgi:hypothetical protein
VRKSTALPGVVATHFFSVPTNPERRANGVHRVAAATEEYLMGTTRPGK